MGENTKKNKALLVGTITYAIGNFGTKFLNFLIVPLYTYFILPEELGDYDLLITTVSLLSPLLTMKISDAAYRWIIHRQENEIPYISATYKLLIRNCLLAVLLMLGINYFVPIWHCYYFIAILIGDRILECLQKLLRGVKNQKLFALSGVFHTFVMVCLNVVMICYFKRGVIAMLQSCVISLYSTIALILACEKRLRVVDFRPNYHNEQKEMLDYSIPLVPSTLSWWVMSASDRYVIRWAIGSAANGIYSVSYKFPSVLQTIFTMFNNAWTDMALAELKKEKQSEQYTQTVFEQLYKVSFGLVLVLIPLTKLVMKLILSASYREAAVYIGFLYLGTVFQGFSSFSSIGYLQGKKTAGAAKTSVIGAVVNLIVDVLCIRYIGLFAAAISTFLGFFVMWLFRMNDIKSVFPIRIELKKFLPYFFVAIVVAVATIWTTNLIDIVMVCVASLLFLISNRKALGMIKKGIIKNK